MATKAELEAELAQLQVELKELRDSTRDDSAAAKRTATENTATNDPDSKDTTADIFHALQDGNFEGIAHQLIEELEGLPHRKPLLLALGALTVGYLIGRSGRKG